MTGTLPPRLLTIADLNIDPSSVVQIAETEFGVARQNNQPLMVLLLPKGYTIPQDLLGADVESLKPQTAHTQILGDSQILVSPPTQPMIKYLRQRVEWLRPQTIGLKTSAGFGDRLGIATPGHIRAMRSAGQGITPIFAQQSIREMMRSNRSPQQVIDDATWAVFVEGWHDGFGADADHLKTPTDINRCVQAGYTFYTIDPGEYVDQQADMDSPEVLRVKFERLLWDNLEDSAASMRRRYAYETFDMEGHKITFGIETVMRAAVKYSGVLNHVVTMYRQLVGVMSGKAFDLEISVDETDTVTTHAEHIFLAKEFQRLGVNWTSLAPRFPGRFEKGVDYIGDLKVFEEEFALHAAIARKFGPYKLSIHSGSDKFSIYPIVAKYTDGLVHLKTAGTSYLEALRTIGQINPSLFRKIYTFACERYEIDRATYHVSGRLDRAPAPDTLSDSDLVALLDQFDVRQILHVTYGSVLTAKRDNGLPRFATDLMTALEGSPETYYQHLETHFRRHLEPFARKSGPTPPTA